MDAFLRKATSVNVTIGPCKDRSNAVSAEAGVTPSVAVNKNGTWAARSAGGTVTHQQFGYYRCPLNSVDVGTLGRLKLAADAPATFLPVWHDYMVLPSNVYDAMVADSDKLQVDTTQISGAVAGVRINAEADAAIADARLDELVVLEATGNPAPSSLMDRIMSKSGVTQGFNRETDSLEALRENQGTPGLTSAAVSAAARQALIDMDLDHLLRTSAPAGVPHSNTVIEKIMVAAVGGAFDRATASLEAIRLRGDGAWTTATGFGTQAHVESARADLAADILALNDISAGSVDTLASAAARQALIDMDLDHLLLTSAPAGVPHSNTALEKIMVSAAAGTFSRASHSLKAIRERGDAAWAGSDWSTIEKENIRQALGVSGSKTTAAGGALQLVKSNADALYSRVTASVAVLASAAARQALIDMHVDHLLAASAPAGVPASNTVLEKIMVSTAAGTFTRASHSLKALRERGDAAWTGGGGGASIGSVATVVQSARAALGTDIGNVPHDTWHYSLSAGMVVGQAGFVLRSAAANAGAVVSGAVTSADRSTIASKVWDRARSQHASSGTFGQAVGNLFGFGGTPVDENTGGTDALRLLDSSAQPIQDATVTIYLKSHYDSGLRTSHYIKGQTTTKANGRWRHAIFLTAGSTYTVQFSKSGAIETTTAEITI